MNNIQQNKKIITILASFGIVLLSLFIFLAIVFGKMLDMRPLPSKTATKLDVSVRGSIYSADGFELGLSKKLYKASVNTRSIDPQKKELFINLFSIYADIPAEQVAAKLAQKGYIVLSYNIDARRAAQLRALNQLFLRKSVFVEYEDARGRLIQKMGLNIEPSGNNRSYTYNDSVEPLLGYIKKTDIGKITKSTGLDGVERHYEEVLKPKEDGKITARRDIGFNVIMDGRAKITRRTDGMDVVLHVPLKLQRKIEHLLDAAKEQNRAKELVAGILDSKTGRILALASSNRFNPNRIKQSEVENLKIAAISHSYEPGSTIKPIIYAILLELGRLDLSARIDLNNGSYKLGKYTIRDTVALKSATAEEVLTRSSNIGMVKLTQNLDAQSYHNALWAFGFGRKTGIDLPAEEDGFLRSSSSLRNEINKASLSYGYGMRATFIQQLRAYAAFSNGGFLLTPVVVSHIKDGEQVLRPKTEGELSIISPQNAAIVRDLLVKVVKEGSGKAADVKLPGIVVGGKTGTARIAKDGAYTSLYNGSFYGFASDGAGNNYTIGVVAFESDASEDYYGSKTAAPIFKQIVEVLASDGYLVGESSADSPAL